MEAFAAVFKDLYTSFLLRDVAGKIIPGSLLLLAIASLYVPLTRLFQALGRKVTLPVSGFVAGLAWTVMLGLQNIAQRWHIWRYFPEKDLEGRMLDGLRAQLIVERFMRIACQSERQQYERYVVIKEATGNLFFSALLAIPLLVTSYVMFSDRAELKKEIPGERVRTVRSVLVVFTIVLVVASLHGMNKEHVSKQFYFAEGELNDPDRHPCPENEGQKEGAGGVAARARP